MDREAPPQAPEEPPEEIVTTAEEPQEPDSFVRTAIIAVNETEPRLREEAVAYLAARDDERAIGFLTTALVDPEPQIRQLAFEALYRFGRRVPIQPLAQVWLNHDDGAIRDHAVTLIRLSGGPEADAVLKLLRDRTPTID